MVTNASEENQVELFVLVDNYIVHVTGVSPEGDPLPDIVSLVASILDPDARATVSTQIVALNSRTRLIM